MRRLIPFQAAVVANYWPAAAVVAAPAILFWQFLFGGRALFWGLPLLQFYPWRWLALQQLRSGHIPLWNPHLGSGAPLLANYQSGVFYPPNWLGFVPGVPLDLSLGWVAVLHIMWAGLGMVALTRALRLKPLAQAVAGLSFSLSGYLVARLWFLTIIAAAAWLPWLLWAVTNLEIAVRVVALRRTAAEARRRRANAVLWWIGLVAIMAMQLLAGHAQTAFYSLVIAAAWAGWRAWHPLEAAEPQPPSDQSRHTFRIGLRAVLRAEVLFAGAAAFAVMLAALQLLPTAELLRQSQRSGAAGYEFVVTYSFWPWRLLGLFAPDAFGNPGRGDYWGYGNYWEDAAYVGILPLGLAALAVAAWFRERRSPIREMHPALFEIPVLIVLALAALLLALGQNTPVFPFLYRHVPTFDLFQAPARMMIGFVLALSLLAGIGADAWGPLGTGQRRWAARAITAGLGIALAGLAVRVLLGVAAGPNRLLETVPGALALAGLLTAVGFGLALLRPQRIEARWQAAVVVFVALDLIGAGWRLNPAGDPALFREQSESGETLRASLDGHRLYQFEQDEYEVKFNRVFRFDSFSPPDDAGWQVIRDTQLPNLPVLEGMVSANNFDPLIPARYAAYVEWLQAAEPVRQAAMLRALDVQAVISTEPIAGMERIYEGGVVAGYAVPGQAARVRIVYAAVAASGPEEALAIVSGPDFDPEQMAVIEGPLPAELTPAAPTSAQATNPVLLTDTPTQVTIAAPMEFPGYLVLADAYYPGWRAYVDGQPEEIVPANVAFRGVYLPAGQRLVEFRYEPATWRTGLVLSVLGWLAFTALAAWAWRVRTAGV